MAASGIRADEDVLAICKNVIQAEQAGGIPYCFLHIDGTAIACKHKAEPKSYTFADYKDTVWADILTYVGENKGDCFWLLADFKFVNEEGSDRAAVLMASFVPDTAKAKVKMLVGSTTNSLKAQLDCSPKGFFASNVAELDFEKVKASIAATMK